MSLPVERGTVFGEWDEVGIHHRLEMETPEIL
jgi:hypothetical protein